jgi:hypothetical protein
MLWGLVLVLCPWGVVVVVEIFFLIFGRRSVSGAYLAWPALQSDTSPLSLSRPLSPGRVRICLSSPNSYQMIDHSNGSR